MDSLKEIKNFECSKCINLQFIDDCIININVGKGVHLVNLDASCVSQQLLKRQYLPASSRVPLKYLLSTIDNQVMWSFDFNSMRESFCDIDTFEFFSRCPPRPFVLHSRLSSSYEGIRYLACITNHGALEIYQEISEEWTEVFDVAESWLRESYNSMERPVTWFDWKTLLDLGKPISFCWVQMQSYLLLTVLVKNGELAVFCKTASDEFSMKIVRRLPCYLKKPSTVFGFERSDKMCLILGSSSGRLMSLTFNPFKDELITTTSLWDAEDYLSPRDIVSVKKENNTFVVTSKCNFLLIHMFKEDGEVCTTERDFGDVVKCLGVSNNVVYIAFDNGKKAVRLKLLKGDSEGEVKCPEDCNNTLDGVGISQSGLFWVIASSMSWTRCRISFLTLANGNPASALDGQLCKGGKLSQNLDLLWLLKFTLLDSAAAENTSVPTSESKKLLYWKLQLRLAGEADEKLEKSLKAVEEDLIVEYSARLKAKGIDLQPFLRFTASSDLEFCLICSSAVISSDVRVVECAKAHVLPRCSITFKPCGSAYYAVCTLCDAIAMLSPEPGFPTFRYHECPFCDGTFKISHGLV